MKVLVVDDEVGKGIELLHLRQSLVTRGRESEIEVALGERHAHN